MLVLKNARCVRRILARAKRRSRAFSKVSPSSAFLSPFVVELVCDFYFARDSSSSESPAWRYTTPAMPTFCRNEGECSKRLRGEREWRFFVSEKCLLKTRLLRAACVLLVALFLPFFFSFLDVCVLSWPADIVFRILFFRVVWPSTKECNTPTKRRIKYSLKSLST